MDSLKAYLSALRFSQSSVPLALLGLCLVSYGLLVPWLGFYWDDIAFQWIAEKLGRAGLIRYFASARPVWGLFIRADLALLGSLPWVWQLFGIFWRWLCAVMLWIMLRLLWPQRARLAVRAALLFAVYPGFDQQFIPINFGHFFMVYTALLFSFGAMLAAARRLGRAWVWTGFGLIFSAVNLLCMEYFYLLDLLRPVLLWLVVSERVRGFRPRLRRTAALWAPYLAVFLGVSFWRAFLFENQTLGNQPKLLGLLAARPFEAAAQLAGTILKDLWQTAIQAWGEAFRLPDIAVLGARTTAVYGLLTAGVFLFVLAYLRWLRVDGEEYHPLRTRLIPGALGALALLIAGWPFWLTQLVVGLRQPNSRFTLPFTLGAVLLAAMLLSLLPRRPGWLQTGTLALLTAFSAGYQFQVANQYRRSLDAQRQFFWQMVWRVPELAEGTAVLTNDLPISYVTDNSLTAMLNWVYAPENGSERMSHFLYYPSLRQDTVLQGMQPDRAITHNYWAAVFYGSTSQMVAVDYAPPACLRVLDPEVDPENPTIPILLRKAAELSSWEWILPLTGEQTARPPAQIYGAEPVHGWCYYYQKAELARQQTDWEGVVQVGEEAFGLGEYPNNPAERYPFIEGYAQTGRWEQAVGQTAEAAAITPLVHPPLCRLWKRIDAHTQASTDKAAAFEQLSEVLKCEDLIE
ncbi:MAG: hypothetical protein IT308_01740 [Anaerolineaceae bacterium]|nr:hypothetical protein [Anaerolineaceae bacterium]